MTGMPRLQRVEKVLADRGGSREDVLAADRAAADSGTATLVQYARLYGDVIAFTRMIVVSEFDQILNRLASDCCASSLFHIIGYPPDVQLPKELELPLTVLHCSATDIWVKNNWWRYVSRGSLSIPEDEWAFVRGLSAIYFLALKPPALRIDVDTRDCDAMEMRRELFLETASGWVPSPIVESVRSELRDYEMDEPELAYADEIRQLLRTKGECRCWHGVSSSQIRSDSVT